MLRIIPRLTVIIHEIRIECHVSRSVQELVDDWCRYFSRKTCDNTDQSTWRAARRAKSGKQNVEGKPELGKCKRRRGGSRGDGKWRGEEDSFRNKCLALGWCDTEAKDEREENFQDTRAMARASPSYIERWSRLLITAGTSSLDFSDHSLILISISIGSLTVRLRICIIRTSAKIPISGSFRKNWFGLRTTGRKYSEVLWSRPNKWLVYSYADPSECAILSPMTSLASASASFALL